MLKWVLALISPQRERSNHQVEVHLKSTKDES